VFTGGVVQVAQPSQLDVHLPESTDEPLKSSAKTWRQLPAMPSGAPVVGAAVVGAAVADGVAVGVAEAVGFGVALAVAEAVAVGVAVGFGVAVAVGLGVAVAVGFGVAVGVGDAEVAGADGVGLGVTVVPFEVNAFTGARLCHTLFAL
jgi:hypothetical protein